MPLQKNDLAAGLSGAEKKFKKMHYPVRKKSFAAAECDSSQATAVLKGAGKQGK